MAATGGTRTDKGPAEILNDLWQLCRDYAKQETIDPLKSIGRFLGYGLAGAVLVSTGIMFVALAVLRALQTETGDRLTGSLNWVPYLVSLIVTLVAIALAVSAIKRPLRAEAQRTAAAASTPARPTTRSKEDGR